MRRIQQMAVRFCVGYLVGMILVFCVLVAEGDHLINTLKLLLLWLPIGFAYGLLTVTIIGRAAIVTMPLSFEICGACVGIFPLVSGLWPTYWMRLDAALLICGIQCLVLLFAMLIRYCVYKLSGR